MSPEVTKLLPKQKPTNLLRICSILPISDETNIWYCDGSFMFCSLAIDDEKIAVAVNMGDRDEFHILETFEIPPALFRVDIRVSHCSSTSPSRVGFEAVNPLAAVPSTQGEVDELLENLKCSPELQRARMNVIEFWDSRKAADSAIYKLKSEGSRSMCRVYKVNGADLAKGGILVVKGSRTWNTRWVVGDDANDKWFQSFWVWGSIPVTAVQGSYGWLSPNFESRSRKFSFASPSDFQILA